MQTDFQRFEAKYLLSEVQTAMVLNTMMPHLLPDAHPVYPVISLYWDNPALRCFWSSETGEKNRFKIRMRTYSEDRATPVFFEVKRRMNDVILKRRCVVRRDYAESLVSNWQRVSESLMRSQPHDIDNLYYFRDHVESHGAEPRMVVRYNREAYIGRETGGVRVTFDRDLRYAPCDSTDPDLWCDLRTCKSVERVPVVMEVKFTTAMPAWISQAIQALGLRRTSMAKYVECVKMAAWEGYPGLGDVLQAAS